MAEALQAQGYQHIGDGTRAIVLAHPIYPDVVVKVGVYDGNESWQRERAPHRDGWLLYIQNRPENNPHTPRVEEIVLHDNCYVATMERLEYLDDFDDYWDTPTLLHDDNGGLNSLLKQIHTHRPAGVSFDMHDQNVMRRPGTGEVVVTDPWCL